MSDGEGRENGDLPQILTNSDRQPFACYSLHLTSGHSSVFPTPFRQLPSISPDFRQTLSPSPLPFIHGTRLRAHLPKQAQGDAQTLLRFFGVCLLASHKINKCVSGLDCRTPIRLVLLSMTLAMNVVLLL